MFLPHLLEYLLVLDYLVYSFDTNKSNFLKVQLCHQRSLLTIIPSCYQFIELSLSILQQIQLCPRCNYKLFILGNKQMLFVVSNVECIAYVLCLIQPDFSFYWMRLRLLSRRYLRRFLLIVLFALYIILEAPFILDRLTRQRFAYTFLGFLMKKVTNDNS